LADALLPGPGGAAFLRQVRRDHPDVVRLLFSSRGDTGADAAAAPAGLYQYVGQPWDPDVLLPCVRQAARQYELQANPPPPQASSRPPGSARPPAVLEPGARLGQYQVLARLGEGGMGVVYQARHRLLGRVVAL